MKTFQKHQLQHLEHYQFASHLLTMAKAVPQSHQRNSLL